MDSALWFLTKLRFQAAIRRMVRAVSTVKGALLTAAGLAIFAPQIIMAFAMPFMPAMHSPQIDASIRRFGALGLFAYVLLVIFTSAGERSIYFSPAEVDFLFPAPFSRRRLLAYKVGVQLLSAVLVSLIMSAFVMRLAASMLAGLMSVMLAIVFIQLLAVAASLASASLGAMAYNLGRRIALAAIGAAIVMGLAQVGHDLLLLEPLQILDRVEKSTAIQIILAPLRPFPAVFTSARLWPDLIGWGTLCLAIDLGLFALIFALDAQYLESAATNSARVYAKLQRMRQGGMIGPTLQVTKGKRVAIPLLPWLGGAGPIAWRQLTTAARDFARLLLALFVLGMTVLPSLFAGGGGKLQDPEAFAMLLMSMALGMPLVLTALIPFDFRADHDRLPELKAMPVSDLAMVVGQILTPVVVLTAMQGLLFCVLGLRLPRITWVFWALASFALPLNLFQFGLENLWFLLFPTRPMGAGTFDVQAMGRYMLLILVKLVVVGGAVGLAFAVGAGIFYVIGEGWMAGFAAAWVVMTALSLVPIPLMTMAFRKLDVARDVPA